MPKIITSLTALGSEEEQTVVLVWSVRHSRQDTKFIYTVYKVNCGSKTPTLSNSFPFLHSSCLFEPYDNHRTICDMICYVTVYFHRPPKSCRLFVSTSHLAMPDWFANSMLLSPPAAIVWILAYGIDLKPSIQVWATVNWVRRRARSKDSVCP